MSKSTGSCCKRLEEFENRKIQTRQEVLKEGEEYYDKSLWAQATLSKRVYLRKLIEEWEKEVKSGQINEM